MIEKYPISAAMRQRLHRQKIDVPWDFSKIFHDYKRVKGHGNTYIVLYATSGICRFRLINVALISGRSSRRTSHRSTIDAPSHRRAAQALLPDEHLLDRKDFLPHRVPPRIQREHGARLGVDSNIARVSLAFSHSTHSPLPPAPVYHSRHRAGLRAARHSP